jgi:hypothetical protein
MNYYFMQYKVVYYVSFVIMSLLIVFFFYADDYVETPFFYTESGFYDEPFYLEISVPKGTIVYYTLDSTDPDENAVEYKEPIYLENATEHENVYSMYTDVSTGFYTDLIEQYQTIDADPGYVAPNYLIDKCNVVRAIAIDKHGHKSEIRTASYFVGINADSYDGCNIISVVTNPDNLFDYEKGIYVTGKTFDEYLKTGIDNSYWRFWSANYRQRGSSWERSVFITFFNADGKLVSTQQGAIRIHGADCPKTVSHMKPCWGYIA